jgi:hypothetical protein
MALLITYRFLMEFLNPNRLSAHATDVASITIAGIITTSSKPLNLLHFFPAAGLVAMHYRHRMLALVLKVWHDTRHDDCACACAQCFASDVWWLENRS